METDALVKLSAIWGTVVLLAVLAAVGKLDSGTAALGIAVIAGVAGYQVYTSRQGNDKKGG